MTMELAEKYSIIPFNEKHIKKIQVGLVDRNGDEKIRVEKIVTINEIKQVQAGYGSSRIGIIVLLGYSRNYLFNVSNRGLCSDFGGGISKKEKLYDGMIRELGQEIPFWAEYFLKCTEEDYVKCHVVETLYLDKPDKNMIEALVFIMVDDYEFETLPLFEPTKEVKSLFYVQEPDINIWLGSTDNTLLNTGLIQYKKYLMDIL
jgi:hypothetical protein